MLFDFHEKQNSKKSGSIHAVYLVSGFVAAAPPAASTQLEQGDGEDVSMQSSPFMSSSMPQKEEDDELLTARTVALCRQEDLEGAQAIPIYIPTGPRPLPTDSAAALNGGSAKVKSANPPMKKKSPSIQNQEGTGIQRRTSSQVESKPKEPAAKQSTREGKDVGKTPSLKREQSDLFKSFSKTQAKVSRKSTDSSAGASPAPQSEDFAPSREQAAKPSRPTRSEREDQLRKMMDDEGNIKLSAASRRATTEEDPDGKPEETKEIESSHENQKSSGTMIEGKQGEAEQEKPATVSGGRRRGRRKVMKKKTLRDEEGYLGWFFPLICGPRSLRSLIESAVTKEEPAWESFSEDEPPPKGTTLTSTPSSISTKGQKTTAKKGQGNLMSFFGKK
ncbi:MAG: hypothetical protein Q9202_001614 [Teloschistes flavicans]